MMERRVRLRPHHLLCTQSYQGKGYSGGFVENMDRIVTGLRAADTAEIELVYTTDDLCGPCPQKQGEGVCRDDGKVLVMDQKVVDHFGLEEGIYNYACMTRRIRREMDEARLLDICGDCQWLGNSACKQVLLEKE